MLTPYDQEQDGPETQLERACRHPAGTGVQPVVVGQHARLSLTSGVALTLVAVLAFSAISCGAGEIARGLAGGASGCLCYLAVEPLLVRKPFVVLIGNTLFITKHPLLGPRRFPLERTAVSTAFGAVWLRCAGTRAWLALAVVDSAPALWAHLAAAELSSGILGRSPHWWEQWNETKSEP